MAYAEKTITSLPEFVEYLTDDCKDDEDSVLFRGQREDWQLRPKLARVCPRRGATVLDIERRIFDHFRLESKPYLAAGTFTDWDLLVIGQHHGLLTRLLDWSKNPLAALWFAVENPPTECASSTDDWHPGIVWVFRPPPELYVDTRKNSDPFAIKQSCVLRPYHIASRITAQIGWFTAHACYEQGGFRPMELSSTAEYLTKLIIPGASFCSIRADLDRCGMNRGHLFPDLDGLCRHIEWLHTWLDDEPDNPADGRRRRAEAAKGG